jgi:hypothetical protein
VKSLLRPSPFMFTTTMRALLCSRASIRAGS